MTTTRMVVVLRGELGSQLSLAQKQVAKDDVTGKEIQLVANGAPITARVRAWIQAKNRCKRLEKAIHSLGALQLGDIEDKEF